MSQWVSRTYTYAEPVDNAGAEPEPESGTDSNGSGPDAEAVTIAIRGATSRADYDAGFEEGRKSGFVAGYGSARRVVMAPGHAWAAGFIDGEGTIRIEAPRKSRAGSYTLRLSVTQKYREPLDVLKTK